MQPAPAAPRWAVLANPKFWTAAAVAAILANIVAFYFLHHGRSAPPPKRNLEMVLGAFEYSRVNPRNKQLKHGQILVTLHLAPTLDDAKFRACTVRKRNCKPRWKMPCDGRALPILPTRDSRGSKIAFSSA